MGQCRIVEASDSIRQPRNRVRVLAKYEDGYVCEIGPYEILEVASDYPKPGDEISLYGKREAVAAAELAAKRAADVFRKIQRAESLATWLNQELSRARLDVSEGNMPNVAGINAVVAAIKNIIDGEKP